jgi:cytochrome c
MKHIHLTISLRRAVRLTRNLLCRLCACRALLIALLAFPDLSHATGDADRGKLLFEKRCTGCHSLDQDKEGPRFAGSTAGRQNFKFQILGGAAIAHVTWDDDSLDKWLIDTDSLIADNDMAYRIPKADERADIIRFLETVSMK